MASTNYGFAKLVALSGDEFYIKSPTIILGRHSSNALSDKSVCFCPLSTSKLISRKHAKIFFNFSPVCFQICCICKNDIFVDEKIVTKENGAVTLKNGSSVVIGDFAFLFLLPKNFPDLQNRFKMASEKLIEFDLEIPKKEKTNSLNFRKNNFDRPKEKLLAIVKLIICENSSQKMTYEAVVNAIEQRYRHKHPEFYNFFIYRNL
ncbi:Pre-rRNA-processing protein fhl1 [Bonamia ostreae]|uniref:Pre-rRNA-processing protein fhl1 n=1 Tax=Bonamia ostreae TaxID=126728 RepID=A0ABV2AI49_9EUKA